MSRFPVVTDPPAGTSTREAFDRARAGFGFVPNLIGVMGNSGTVANAYLDLHERFAASSFSPVEQQVVALSASFENGCDYCMAAESAVAGMVKADPAVVEALRAGEPLPDARLEALSSFVKAVVRDRGWVDAAAVEAFLAAGFEAPQVLEVVLGVAKKTLSNYVNHVAGTPLDAAFTPLAWERRRDPVTAG
jgi:AhpD family alkylhydroperoxidase